MQFQSLPLALTAAFALLTSSPALAQQSYQQEATGTGYFRTVPTTGGSSLPTATAPATTTTTTASGLPGLVSQLPSCALPCFESAAKTVKCALSDFKCLCQSSNLNSFALNMGSCLTGGLGANANAGPSASDSRCGIENLSALATQICSRVNSAPGQDELASASAVVSEKLAAATATGASSTGTPKNEAGARKHDGAAVGMLVFAAAYAVLAL